MNIRDRASSLCISLLAGNGETVIELPDQVRVASTPNLRQRCSVFSAVESVFTPWNLEAADFSSRRREERALLVGVELPSNNRKVPLEYSLEELQRLTETAGGKVIQKFSQQIRNVTPATLVGRGKVEEIQSPSKT